MALRCVTRKDGETMSAPLTYSECMARLAACEPMVRGERGALAGTRLTLVQMPRGVLHHWAMLVSESAWLGKRAFSGHDAYGAASWEWRKLAAPLRRAREERQKWKRRVMELAPLMGEVHRLQCQGTFSLERDPFDLIPAIDSYAADEISGGKMREYIRRWLAGESFRVAGTLDHEPAIPAGVRAAEGR